MKIGQLDKSFLYVVTHFNNYSKIVYDVASYTETGFVIYGTKKIIREADVLSWEIVISKLLPLCDTSFCVQEEIKSTAQSSNAGTAIIYKNRRIKNGCEKNATSC